MWDLTVSVPDHCLSFYFATFLKRLSVTDLYLTWNVVAVNSTIKQMYRLKMSTHDNITETKKFYYTFAFGINECKKMCV